MWQSTELGLWKPEHELKWPQVDLRGQARQKQHMTIQ